MKQLGVACVIVSLPGLAQASDFSIVMWLLMIPFAFLALVVWGITWQGTAAMKNGWLKALIRTAGLCLIFTPTYTAGGNGQSLSVALYDVVASMLGGDPEYARQAMVNVCVATPIVSLLVLLGVYLAGRREVRP